MKRKLMILAAAVTVAASSLACGLTINVPVDRVTSGPVVVDDISIPAPDAETAQVTLTFGAGELDIEGGSDDALISGEASYNVPDFKPEVTSVGDSVSLETGNLDLNGIPNFGNKLENKWRLRLGSQQMDLTIEAGAYEGRFDLGGLALRNLNVSDGAASVRLDFNQPNLIEMDSFSYTTGASNVRLRGLANANFSEMFFEGGAGDYLLDFSGELQRSADVKIDSGISNVVIVIPDGMAATVIFEGGLTSIKTDRRWDKSGSTYTLPGAGPMLTIVVDLGAGSLELRVK